MNGRSTKWLGKQNIRSNQRRKLAHKCTHERKRRERYGQYLAESYPAGVPAEVDVHEHRSLGAFFDKSVACFGSRPAFVNMGRAITYAELDRLSRDFGAYLQSELKLKPGARVALMMPNLQQYPIALFAALRSGYTVVNCNPLYTPRELEHQLQDFWRGGHRHPGEQRPQAGPGRGEHKSQARRDDRGR